MPQNSPPSDASAPIYALSTMWSQGRFRGDGSVDDMDAFAQAAARLGYPNIEVNYVIPEDGVRALLEQKHVGISSLHSPTPRIRTADGRLSDALNLASLDADERALAVQRARTTIDYAAQAGVRYVVVHLGGIETEMFDEERMLRRTYDAGYGDEVHALRKRAAEKRREGALVHYPEARRSLAEIAEHAAANNVTIGLENRYHYHEFPSVDEAHELLKDYPPHVAGFWLDMGHAEVLDRLGFIPRRRWLDELADRCVAAHIHDVDGLADHRAPGHGTADWEHYAAKLPPHIPRIMEINQKVPEDQVAAAIPFLRGNGLLPAL